MNKIKITTPENIEIEYKLAGLGSRAAAAVIDFFIQGAAILIILITLIAFEINPLDLYEENGGWVIGVAIIIIWIIAYGYFIIFEMSMNGMTPGKKLFKLRTIRNNGQPITIKHSIIRNLFRIIIDYYGVGVVLMFFTKEYKRVGDLLASTIVVVEEKKDMPDIIDLKNKKANNYRYIITKEEYRLLKKYFYRKEALGENTETLKRELGEYFTEKLKVTKYEREYDIFLNELLEQGANLF
ncbi:RDD family protein [Maledivibacter halophilus]|uniref:Uncharacterized membrane protein YckC, RDD family n=1 Tax=Maledivibacter halophilus TaxID=36842 RepID=A0A1T5J7D7_9FIRM|nr:RDD family protein [Maledivibacter halophilus]SKC47163.1 Uncharacterized membrane protein YckC, RDD family [Maledivibacter halophilus]